MTPRHNALGVFRGAAPTWGACATWLDHRLYPHSGSHENPCSEELQGKWGSGEGRGGTEKASNRRDGGQSTHRPCVTTGDTGQLEAQRQGRPCRTGGADHPAPGSQAGWALSKLGVPGQKANTEEHSMAPGTGRGSAVPGAGAHCPGHSRSRTFPHTRALASPHSSAQAPSQAIVHAQLRLLKLPGEPT